MTLLRPLWMQVEEGDTEVEYSALNDREIIDAMFPYEGVIGLSSLKVSQRAAGATFSVDIAIGKGVVEGDDADDQGRYLVKSTAVENRTTPGAPVSGTLTHRVVAWVQDKLHNIAFSDYEWVIEVLPDVGGGIPDEPDTAITLASITVIAGQTNITDDDITDLRPFAQTPPTRFLQVGSDAERPGAPRLNDIIQRTDEVGIQEIWNGTTWARPSSGDALRAIRFADATPQTAAGIADDADLQVTLEAGIYYRFFCFIVYSAHSSGDLRWQITVPGGGGTLDALAIYEPAATSGTVGQVTFERIIQGGGPYVAAGAAAENTTYMTLVIHGMATGGSGGDAKFRWGQNVTNATGTLLRGKCLFEFTEVA